MAGAIVLVLVVVYGCVVIQKRNTRVIAKYVEAIGRSRTADTQARAVEDLCQFLARRGHKDRLRFLDRSFVRLVEVTKGVDNVTNDWKTAEYPLKVHVQIERHKLLFSHYVQVIDLSYIALSERGVEPWFRE